MNHDNLNALRTGSIAIASQGANELIYASSSTQLARSTLLTFNGTVFTLGGFGAHSISAGGTGANSLTVRNTTAGTGNYGQIRIGNDAAINLLEIFAYSSTFTTSGAQIASGASLSATGVGGLTLSAESASGDVHFFRGATEMGRMHASRGFSWGDTTDPGATNMRVAGTLKSVGAVDFDSTLNVDGTTTLVSDVAVGATKKVYLDGSLSGNTYLVEGSADLLQLVAGGVLGLELSATGTNIDATRPLYFDGGGDTYIKENSANVLRCVAGGTGGVDLTSGATAWVAVSDERVKVLIEPITDAVAKLAHLRTVIGRYRTDDPSCRRSMLIAQDVQHVLPEAVAIDPEGLLGLRYTEVLPLVIAGVNELHRRVKALEDATHH